MQPNDLPLVCLPTDLSDEAAAQLLEFLQALTAALESHYCGQLHRYYSTRDHQQRRSIASIPAHRSTVLSSPDTACRPDYVATIQLRSCDVRSYRARSTKITRFRNPANR